jgi:hypothetical protein
MRPTIRTSLALLAIAVGGCAPGRLRMTPIDDGSPPPDDTFVVARPGGLEVDFVTLLASAARLRVSAHRVAARQVEIRLRSRQTRSRCAVEQRVHFALEGFDRGEWTIVLLDGDERVAAARVQVPEPPSAHARGRRGLRARGC